MPALTRIARVGIAGALLYEAGLLVGDVNRRPSQTLAVVIVTLLAISLGLLIWAVADARPALPTGRARMLHRLAWLALTIPAFISLVWLLNPPHPLLGDVTPFRNDAIAFNECGGQLLLAGHNPYVDLDVSACYQQLELGPDHTTPLRVGQFSNLTRYPTDDELDTAWAARMAGRDGGEFVSRLSYPALTVLLAVPFVWLSWDPNILHVLFLIAAMALCLIRTAPPLRPFMLTGLLGATCVIAFTVGGSSDLLYALPLVAAWLWRERGWSGVALGLALATKQLSWFFVPYLFIAVAAEQGLRRAFQQLGLSLAVFVAVNAPFIVHNAAAWADGVFTTFVAPTFPLGAGIVLLETTGVIPAFAGSAHLTLLVLGEALGLVWAIRSRHSRPELGAVLALAPFFFSNRSLFSYFFLIPLFALAAIARSSSPAPSVSTMKASGALTPFAIAKEAS